MNSNNRIARRMVAAMFTFCVMLISCNERAKVIDVQKVTVKIDTIYTYKIEREGDGGNFYDVEATSAKYETGDIIQIAR